MHHPEIYLDWNATTPPHPAVLDAMRAAQLEAWGNPASVHGTGRRARALVETVRERIAALLELHPRDVLFTSGGTEANNLALHDAPAIVLSKLEHPSVVRTAARVADSGRPVRWLPALADGRVDLGPLEAMLHELPLGTRVAIAAANHETGVLQPLAPAKAITQRAGAWLHVDAVQLLGKARPDALTHADSIALCAHKIRGPKGIGALAWRRGAGPTPLLVGGAQERGLRPGTQDAVLAAGFGAALGRLDESLGHYQSVAKLRDLLERELCARDEGQLRARKPRTAGEVNGTAERLPNVANVSFAGLQGDEVVAALDLLGVRVSSGSACSAGTTEPSPVIETMLGRARATSAVRVSLGETTEREQVVSALHAFFRVLGE